MRAVRSARAADDFQIPGSRQRPDAAVMLSGVRRAGRFRPAGERWGKGLLLTRMNRESPPAHAAAARPAPRSERPRLVLPIYSPGMHIGLFGGTFDPAACGAPRGAAFWRMKRIGLDRVWWLVTPGNPLKDTSGLAPLARAHAGRARSLRIIRASTSPTSKRELGTRYTYQTVSYLVRRLPAGAFRLDNGGRQSACLPSLAALARNRKSGTDCRRRSPRAEPVRRGSAAGQALASFRIPESAAKSLPGRKPPVWIYLHGLKSPLSSTALRAARALQQR